MTTSSAVISRWTQSGPGAPVLCLLKGKNELQRWRKVRARGGPGKDENSRGTVCWPLVKAAQSCPCCHYESKEDKKRIRRDDNTFRKEFKKIKSVKEIVL